MVASRVILAIAVIVAFLAGWKGCAGELRAMSALLLCVGALVLCAHVLHADAARRQLLRQTRLGRS